MYVPRLLWVVFKSQLRNCSTSAFGASKKDGENFLKAEDLVKTWGSLIFPTNACGTRSYILAGSLAEVHNALLGYAFDFLRKTCEFEVVKVEDILPLRTTESCGLIHVATENTLQYLLKNYPGHCLSGTAEMGIANTLIGRIFEEESLPVYFLAKSRCFRPEVSKTARESGIYRVHEFDKIEMFALCAESESDKVLSKLVDIQKQIFSGLDLHCRCLEMPPEDLNPSASRKYDIEVWMPGRKIWGEVSSASNCTDYQAKRLNIQYRSRTGEIKFVHTCNGTALSSARTLIAVLETHQEPNKKGFVPPYAIKERLLLSKRGYLRTSTSPAFHYKF